MCNAGTREDPVRRPPARGNDALDLHDCVLGESKSNGGNRLAFREVIFYEKAHAYPDYIVAFTRVPPDLEAWSKLKGLARKQFTAALGLLPVADELVKSAQFKADCLDIGSRLVS